MNPTTPERATDDPLVSSLTRYSTEALEQLSELVAIPSVSADGSDSEAVERSAQHVLELFRPLLPWSSIDLVRADRGAPAILARLEPIGGAPTVLLYAHHDVQPPGPEDRWTTPPFRAVERHNRLYGRGSADDGAGIIAHWWALRALVDAEGKRPECGIVLFIEGEEEIGSPTLPVLLEQNREKLRSDVIVVADSDNPAPDRPALTTSLRGVVGVTLRVRTLKQPRHSGLFGGPTPDAMGVLVRLLADLYDPDGSVRVHLPSSITVPDDGVVEAEMRAEAGINPELELWGSGSLASRLWLQPALTVTAVDAPALDQASNTLLDTAAARLSLRLPPDVSADEGMRALREAIDSQTPHGVALDLTDWEAGEGFAQDISHPLVLTMIDSLESGYGHTPVTQGVGGSIPFVAHLSRHFPGTPIAVIGVEDRESSAHGIDESVDISMLGRAAHSLALFIQRVGASGTQPDSSGDAKLGPDRGE